MLTKYQINANLRAIPKHLTRFPPKIVKFINKERSQNNHKIEEMKEKLLLNAMWYPELNPGTGKGL